MSTQQNSITGINEFNNFLKDNPEIENEWFGRPVVYFRKFKTIKDLLKHLQDNLNQNMGDWHAYSFYKKELSHICGWDASRENYNQDQYNKTLGRIIRLLKV